MDNHGGNMHGMGGGGGMDRSPQSPASTANGTTGGMMMNNHHRRHMMMHMTFFWGKNAEVLFSGWPGYDNLGMYVVALFVVFLIALVVEWFSHCNFIKENSNHVVAGLLQTLMYGLRIGLAYLVMLAVMSFNGGIFLAAVVGHTLGFFLFGSRAFEKSPPPGGGSWKTSDLPPMSC